MKAQLKRLHSPDVIDLKSFRPTQPDNFGFLLQLMVGTEGEEGEESFDVQVCTPRWLLERYRGKGIVSLRHHVLVFEYDHDRMLEALRLMVESCTGSDWDE